MKKSLRIYSLSVLFLMLAAETEEVSFALSGKYSRMLTIVVDSVKKLFI